MPEELVTSPEVLESGVFEPEPEESEVPLEKQVSQSVTHCFSRLIGSLLCYVGTNAQEKPTYRDESDSHGARA